MKMILMVATGLVSAAFPSSAFANEIAERRAALLAYALAEDEHDGKTLDVRCPIFSASTSGFICVVVNSAVETVGTVYVSSRHLPLTLKTELVERCYSPTDVAADCVANLRLVVKDYVAFAQDLEWVSGE